jgi:hypothetical protein
VVEALADKIEDQNVLIGAVTFATSATVGIDLPVYHSETAGDPDVGRVIRMLNALPNLGADGRLSETNIHIGLAAARTEIFAPLASRERTYRDTDFVVILTDGKIHNGAGGGALTATRALEGMGVGVWVRARICSEEHACCFHTPHAHTRTLTHTHTRTRTHAHARTYRRTHARTYARTYSPAHLSSGGDQPPI